jgi:PhnB protein
MAVKPIPEGYHSVTPYLIVDGAGALIDFMKQAFDAEETVRMDTPDGKVGHAEFRIGDSIVMLADSATSDWDAIPATVVVYVEDVDKTYRRALEAGGTSVRDVADQFYGDRAGGVRDPVGNHWWIHTHVEDVPPEEVARRAQEWQAQQQS